MVALVAGTCDCGRRRVTMPSWTRRHAGSSATGRAPINGTRATAPGQADGAVGRGQLGGAGDMASGRDRRRREVMHGRKMSASGRRSSALLLLLLLLRLTQPSIG